MMIAIDSDDRIVDGSLVFVFWPAMTDFKGYSIRERELGFFKRKSEEQGG
jgi:hypothetical protein